MSLSGMKHNCKSCWRKALEQPPTAFHNVARHKLLTVAHKIMISFMPSLLGCKCNNIDHLKSYNSPHIYIPNNVNKWNLITCNTFPTVKDEVEGEPSQECSTNDALQDIEQPRYIDISIHNNVVSRVLAEKLGVGKVMYISCPHKTNLMYHYLHNHYNTFGQKWYSLYTSIRRYWNAFLRDNFSVSARAKQGTNNEFQMQDMTTILPTLRANTQNTIHMFDNGEHQLHYANCTHQITDNVTCGNKSELAKPSLRDEEQTLITEETCAVGTVVACPKFLRWLALFGMVIGSSNEEEDNTQNKDNMQNKDNSDVTATMDVSESASEPPPAVVPCLDGRELGISPEIVTAGLAAISVKHPPWSKNKKPSSKSRISCKFLPRISTSLCTHDSCSQAGKLVNRNSFWNVHRPELSKLEDMSNQSLRAIEMFFHEHLSEHGHHCRTLRRHSVRTSSERDSGHLKGNGNGSTEGVSIICPPAETGVDEEDVFLPENQNVKRRSIDIDDDDLNPENILHHSTAQFCVRLGNCEKAKLTQTASVCLISKTKATKSGEEEERKTSLPKEYEPLLSKDNPPVQKTASSGPKTDVSHKNEEVTSDKSFTEESPSPAQPTKENKEQNEDTFRKSLEVGKQKKIEKAQTNGSNTRKGSRK